jgi:hypothetical protein
VIDGAAAEPSSKETTPVKEGLEETSDSTKAAI